MNSRFVPTPGHTTRPLAAAPVLDAAMVTASYAPDFERCRLLCETMDRFVAGARHHYLLVEHGDVALFRTLEGPNRTVVDERDLLPSWLRSWPDPTSGFRRRIWLSPRTMPLRGWHVQQMRRIAIAGHIGEQVLVYCDSDVAFVKPFDCATFSRSGKVRLFRRDDALEPSAAPEHAMWSANAADLLGIAAPKVSPHDYIATLIAWRRSAVVGMCNRIETVTGRHWAAALGVRRRFSECITYGRYVDEVLGGEGHFHAHEELCRVHWTGEPMSEKELSVFLDTMEPYQVAVGMQSFIGTDLGRIRRVLDAR